MSDKEDGPKTFFIQNSHFGLTIGYRFESGQIHVACSFAHKHSYNGKEYFEQFCRKNGRRVTTSRLNGIAPSLKKTNEIRIPYTFTLHTSTKDKEGKELVRKATYEVLDNHKSVYEIPANQAKPNEQERNDYLVTKIKQVLMEQLP